VEHNKKTARNKIWILGHRAFANQFHRQEFNLHFFWQTIAGIAKGFMAKMSKY